MNNDSEIVKEKKGFDESEATTVGLHNDEDSETEWFIGSASTVLPEETAQKEVVDWLNTKNMSVRRRKNRMYSIDMMVGAIMDGDLSMVDGKWVQKLRIVIGTSKSLTYDNRRDTGTYQGVLKQMKIDGSDSDGVHTATVAVLTGNTFQQMSKLEEEDRELAHCISLFFN
jgi:hypothetical protein